jgi:excisionase family DNA binding protein
MDRQRGTLVNSGLFPDRKQPEKAFVASDDKLLVGREEAAEMLSISCRALDYLVANKQLKTRRIGSRVLIPTSDLRRFARADHPEKLVG